MAVADVGEFVLDALAHFAEGVVFVFFTQTVGLVDEDVEIDARIVLGKEDGGSKELADAAEVLILTVDDPDDGADVGEDGRMIVAGRENR